MNIAIVLLALAIGVSVQAQEWTFPPLGVTGSSVNQFDNSPRTNPIRQIGGAFESTPSFWNVPIATVPINEFAQPSAVNHFGQAPSQASPLYNAAYAAHHPTSVDSCCTSPTTVQMAKDIAETLSVLRAIAVSLETLNTNFNRTISIEHHLSDDKLSSSDAYNTEKLLSSGEPSTVVPEIFPTE